MATCSRVLAWESHGQRGLVATVHAESNMTEHTHACVHTHTHTHTLWASLVAQLVKNPPAMQETLVQFLGPEDPPEKA